MYDESFDFTVAEFPSEAARTVVLVDWKQTTTFHIHSGKSRILKR